LFTPGAFFSFGSVCVAFFFFFGLRSASGIGGPRAAKAKQLQHLWGTLAGVFSRFATDGPRGELFGSAGIGHRVYFGERMGEKSYIFCVAMRECIISPTYLPST